MPLSPRRVARRGELEASESRERQQCKQVAVKHRAMGMARGPHGHRAFRRDEERRSGQRNEALERQWVLLPVKSIGGLPSSRERTLDMDDWADKRDNGIEGLAVWQAFGDGVTLRRDDFAGSARSTGQFACPSSVWRTCPCAAEVQP